MEFKINQMLFLLTNLKNNIYIQILIVSVLLDLITKFIKSIKYKRISFKYMFDILTNCIVILINLVTWVYSIFLGYEFLSIYINLFFIIYYLSSILDNLKILKIPIPIFIKNLLNKLKKEFK